MRVICKLNEYDENYAMSVGSFMRSIGLKFVVRHFVSLTNLHRVYVMESEGYYRQLVPTGFVNITDKWWEVTACNKQYISEHTWDGQPQSLGSMCEVTEQEARDHVFNWQAHKRWYLLNEDTGVHWLPLKQNPNRVGNHTSPGKMTSPCVWPIDPRCPRPPEGVLPL